MSDIRLTGISVYPVKSCAGQSLSEVNVNLTGLEYDRELALVDDANELITARECPQLLSVSTGLSASELTVYHAGSKYQFALDATWDATGDAVGDAVGSSAESVIRFFSESLSAISVSSTASQWFSGLLGEPCRLIRVNPEKPRELLERRGGRPGEQMALADECPLLIVSTNSLENLNVKLSQSGARELELAQFRPNLVISGCEAFAEDELGRFKIGDMEFDILQRCKRCDLATINPETGAKDQRQEPLRTLATYRKQPQGGVTFGAHAIARNSGLLTLGMTLER